MYDYMKGVTDSMWEFVSRQNTPKILGVFCLINRDGMSSFRLNNGFKLPENKHGYQSLEITSISSCVTECFGNLTVPRGFSARHFESGGGLGMRLVHLTHRSHSASKVLCLIIFQTELRFCKAVS